MAPPRMPRYVEVASDLQDEHSVDSDCDSEGSDPAACRARPRGCSWASALSRRDLACIASLAGVLAVASLATRGSSAAPGRADQGRDRARGSPGSRISAYANLFTQCGGNGWIGPTCCEIGCACLVDTLYYSQCTTPHSHDRCNVKGAAEEAKKAGKEVARWEPVARQKAEAARRAEARVAASKKRVAAAYAAKKAAAATAAARLTAARRTAKAQVATATAEAAKAAAAAQEKAAANHTVAAAIAEDRRNSILLSSGSCAGLYGQCGGTGFDIAKACCQEGCRCSKKEKLYMQCEPLDGSKVCNPAAAAKRTRALYTDAGRLKMEAGAAAAESAYAAKRVRDAKAAAAETLRAAKAPAAAEAKAATEVEAAEAEALAARREVHELRLAARRLKHQANVSSKTMLAWQMAAGIIDCHDDGLAGKSTNSKSASGGASLDARSADFGGPLSREPVPRFVM